MTYGWKLIICVCGQGLTKVKGEYETICHKCGAINKGDTRIETSRRPAEFTPACTK